MKEIWAIGGGKGGIGKSFIISSMANYIRKNAPEIEEVPMLDSSRQRAAMVAVALLSIGSVAEIIVPMGAERTARVSEKTHRMYVVVVGDIEFRVAGETFRAGPGDTVQIRFTLGVDGCNGVDGWYLDHIQILEVDEVARRPEGRSGR